MRDEGAEVAAHRSSRARTRQAAGTGRSAANLRLRTRRSQPAIRRASPPTPRTVADLAGQPDIAEAGDGEAAAAAVDRPPVLVEGAEAGEVADVGPLAGGEDAASTGSSVPSDQTTPAGLSRSNTGRGSGRPAASAAA